MRVTQGTFSYLPDLNDEEIAAQVHYAAERDWALSVEFTDEPHPRNAYWEMWGLPLFDVTDPETVLTELRRCREAFPDHYIQVRAYDASHTRQTTALAFLVHRPANEPAFRLSRQE